MSGPQDYTLFKDFIDKFLPQGFVNIDRQDPFMVDMEEKLKHNHQFFYMGDLLQMKLLFTSSGSLDIIGVDPDQLDLSTFITRVHPEDRERYSLARAHVIKSGYELLIKHSGTTLLSSHFRQRNVSGNYFNLLFQAYSFYTETPGKTIYTMLLLTDLSSFNIDKHGYHYYSGDDPALFRYPDDELLKIGHVFSGREFDIIKLIADGMGSEQIADKLFLSVNTVNTHRRNILKKTKKSTTHDLVIELRERGIL
jgi:DNA-binding CsgD family transcriptional regulator